MNEKYVDSEDSSDEDPRVRQDNVVEDAFNMGKNNHKDGVEKYVEMFFDEEDSSEEISSEEVTEKVKEEVLMEEEEEVQEDAAEK